MYYEEQIINGRLCHRSDPKGEWIPFPESELAFMYQEQKRVNAFYSSTITQQAETIRLLKEDAERLVENWEYYEDHCGYCVHCMESQGSDDVHADDCPITLHTALMNSLEWKE